MGGLAPHKVCKGPLSVLGDFFLCTALCFGHVGGEWKGRNHIGGDSILGFGRLSDVIVVCACDVMAQHQC